MKQVYTTGITHTNYISDRFASETMGWEVIYKITMILPP